MAGNREKAASGATASRYDETWLEGAKLAEIDERLDVLEVEGRALLKAMRPKPVKSIKAIFASLAVAARLIFAEDHPEAHGLITRAVRDLAAFSGG